MKQKIILARADIALLITRLILGGIFINAGWTKITNISFVIEKFSAMHIPAFLTYIVAYGEFIGGILLVLGLWVWIVATFLSIIMLVAIYLTRSAGIEMFGLPLVTLAGLISLVGNGGGKYSVERFFKK